MPKDERLQKAFQQVALVPVRIRHRRRAVKKQKVRASALDSIRNSLRGASELNAKSAKTVFNVGLYVLLLDQDLSDFTDDLISAGDDRRRVFLAKHEAVLLYEAAEDLPQLLGKEFRAAARNLGASSDQMATLNEVSSALNTFWRFHREFLGSIRNVLAAHRDHDSLKYVESLESLKPLEVMARGADLSRVLEQLVAVLVEFTLLVGQPGTLLKDMIASKKAATTG